MFQSSNFENSCKNEKEENMEHSRSNFAVLAMLVIIGVGAIVRFSHDVRVVQVVGLTGGGAACGVALCGFIWAFMTRDKS
jgi:hypothetical protein